MDRYLSEKTIKVVIAKPGLDGHDTGAKVVAHALKDAGMEVIYTGLHRTIEEIVATALEEDADVIGLSIYSGAHLPLSKKLIEQLKERDIADKIVLVGGNIPQRDVKTLKKYGITEVFPIGAKLENIVEFIKDRLKRKNEKI
ncbi:MAG: cobalamin B12-binding domain-containing protein [Candidatus Aminicenantes bacterium]|nr:cobalamin B12-binding domain-containing protein [Candidatus Aminicenantes bacterium]